ncbi:hypothetical protein FEP07_04795 [Burkholderia multivorans]|nr:hypothetical protein [Burkholderia multivorans]MDR9266445.1 hypothetical protein [Burkholderia multivorans]MDR9287336.1 hypothetical protein [Burkholderia multivorans]MDR9338670.1 hypothetical protein [Burkholderia multivorans]MDR9349791.1 hypothetical protein [Burkholderia multivorans]
MSDLMTCEATTSAISSQESASGRTRFDAQAGPMIDLFGPVPVRANLSPRQAKELGLTTSGTSGLRGTGSSVSADLSRCLVNRLQALPGSAGSIEFSPTSRTRTTPAGRSISALAASDFRFDGRAFTLWPTPTVNDSRGGRNRTAVRSNPNSAHHDGVTLVDAARLHCLTGEMLSAPTEIVGCLNPALSRSLMGLPAMWDDCAPTATRSTPKRQRNSSSPRAKS